VIRLQDALDELGHAYEQSHSGARVSFNYGGSGTLQFEIKQGAPVDVFISAAQNQTDALEPKGLSAMRKRDAILSRLSSCWLCRRRRPLCGIFRTKRVQRSKWMAGVSPEPRRQASTLDGLSHLGLLDVEKRTV